MKKKTYIAPVAKIDSVRVEKGFQLSATPQEPIQSYEDGLAEALRTSPSIVF